jgi:hydrophobe/amphiphile efflux-1 (HAE1) family protein
VGISRFFIDRPIFAIVLSIFVTVVGGAAYFTLPIAQYPEVAPPTLQVAANYPGASAKIVSETVATPLEQQINGIENLEYFSSQSTGDGKIALTLTFRLGTDLNTALELTQSRVLIAQPRLPQVVQQLGVVVKKVASDYLIVPHLYSPDGSRDQLYLSNYATLHIKDAIARLDGVGDVQTFGARDYAMRIWLDPDKVASHNLTAGDVVAALRAQNTEVSAGVLAQPPVANPNAFQINVEALGRLTDPAQFADIVVKADNDGRMTRVNDLGRVELGAVDYGADGYKDHVRSVPILIYRRPGSNELKTAREIRKTMAELSKDFPPGVAYMNQYDATVFIAQSVHEVVMAIVGAVLLVVAVVILFLQTWQASIIPIVAIPVSLIGTFAILATLGFSLNSLSLFGLVLAVGIVVDDAIVVVENVERNLRLGLSSRDAARQTMDEVGLALIAIALALCAVFVPAAFISGIAGEFFRQFAVTIAASTLISCLISLTLSPALCAVLLRPHQTHDAEPRRALVRRLTYAFFSAFNRRFEWMSDRFGQLTAGLIHMSVAVVLVYIGLTGLTAWQFSLAPTGFVPNLDQGYLITVIQLPPGSSLARTDDVTRKVNEILTTVPGVYSTAAFAGLDGATFTLAPNEGAIFSVFKSFEEREKQGLTAKAILASINQRLAGIKDGFIITVEPPPVNGIGGAGGFKMMLEDKGNLGPAALEMAARDLVTAANADPRLTGVFTPFSAATPNVFVDIDRVRAAKLGLPPERVFETMQVYLGSAYINDFNYLGRTYQVFAQAEDRFRMQTDDIPRFKTRNQAGDMVPLGSVVTFRNTAGPYRLPRYNQFPAAEIQGSGALGVSSGTALMAMEQIAAERLPKGIGYEWTDLAFEQKQTGNTALLLFGASAFFVFMVLAAQYESWSHPLAVILIVPMCLLAAVSGLLLRGMSVDILAQIGFVVLVALASKNAILIVEFAKQAQDAGAPIQNAAIEAARTRLRPILMTSLAFILGVVPLALATGAGAEMRQSLGTAVFFGMLGVTLFGLLFTPTCYTVVQRMSDKVSSAAKHRISSMPNSG